MQFSIGYILRQVRAAAEDPLGTIYRTQHSHKAALRTDEINVQSITNGGNK